MNYDIAPISEGDLVELSQFLRSGFAAPEEADFAAVDVLRWKYLDTGHEQQGLPLSFVARGPDGKIIGHIGICRTWFEGYGLAQAGRIETIHIIDWLGSAEHRAVGTALMRRAHQGVATQFGLGVSPSALIVGERIGYELRSLLPVYRRVVRASYWLRVQDERWGRNGLRLMQDLAWRAWRPRSAGKLKVLLDPVSTFGHEILPVVAQAGQLAAFTARDPARLNRHLRFPRQCMTAWHILDAERKLRGFALTNIVPTDQGATRTGKIVDFLLDTDDMRFWRSSAAALTHALALQGADIVLAYASTPWEQQAFEQTGFLSTYAVKFHIRDRQGLIPRGTIFHLTPLEGDYAYT